MRQKPKKCQGLVFGEQLTGLSPMACRRAVKAIREEDERLGGEKRKEDLPEYCKGLIALLFSQIDMDGGPNAPCMPLFRSQLHGSLDQMVIFLNIVEGIEPAEAQKPAGDRIPPGTFDDRAAIMEESSGRG